MHNLIDMLSTFVTANTASTSGSGTLPGNTVTNPKEDLKGITTRSGVTIQGPKAINHDTEVTKDTMPPANNGSTEDVPTPVVQTQTEKLSELARTPLNENCSAVILNKLPKKLGDPGRFLIPCEFTGITTCTALADLGASLISLPYSVWKESRLPGINPTCMTLELADASPSLNQSAEITLRVGKEAITFNLDQTSKYTADYDHMTANKIDVIEMACDEYSQEGA
ncbi:hypothetical protein Tco_0162911 [Tanacetum coccineum]